MKYSYSQTYIKGETHQESDKPKGSDVTSDDLRAYVRRRGVTAKRTLAYMGEGGLKDHKIVRMY